MKRTVLKLSSGYGSSLNLKKGDIVKFNPGVSGYYIYKCGKTEVRADMPQYPGYFQITSLSENGTFCNIAIASNKSKNARPIYKKIETERLMECGTEFNSK